MYWFSQFYDFHFKIFIGIFHESFSYWLFIKNIWNIWKFEKPLPHWPGRWILIRSVSHFCKIEDVLSLRKVRVILPSNRTCTLAPKRTNPLKLTPKQDFDVRYLYYIWHKWDWSLKIDPQNWPTLKLTQTLILMLLSVNWKYGLYFKLNHIFLDRFLDFHLIEWS